MQAKDVDSRVFLAVVAIIQVAKGGGWALWCDIAPAYPDVPLKVLRAKAKKLIKQGLLDGCAWGCRGDFEIPARSH